MCLILITTFLLTYLSPPFSIIRYVFRAKKYSTCNTRVDVRGQRLHVYNGGKTFMEFGLQCYSKGDICSAEGSHPTLREKSDSLTQLFIDLISACS